MGTRGLVTFVTTDGAVKSSYMQYDAYPTGVGKEVLSFLHKAATTENIDAMTKLIDDLVVVSQETKPTQRQQDDLRMYADPRVSTGELDEWYVLLRRTQGNPALTLHSGHIEDTTSFGNDSLFCEWVYAINMHDKTFEVYEGFQKGKVAQHGIWAGAPVTGDYGSVERVAVWPLTDLPNEEEFINALVAEEDRG